MKNYLICNIQYVTDIDGNFLGKRICDVSENTFPISEDYQWKEYVEYFDIYTGQWYWADDKPNEYISPVILPIKENDIETQGTQEL